MAGARHAVFAGCAVRIHGAFANELALAQRAAVLRPAVGVVDAFTDEGAPPRDAVVLRGAAILVITLADEGAAAAYAGQAAGQAVRVLYAFGDRQALAGHALRLVAAPAGALSRRSAQAHIALPTARAVGIPFALRAPQRKALAADAGATLCRAVAVALAAIGDHTAAIDADHALERTHRIVHAHERWKAALRDAAERGRAVLVLLAAHRFAIAEVAPLVLVAVLVREALRSRLAVASIAQ